MRVSFHTLGCRLNQAETALAADDMARHGWEVLPWPAEADVLVINSCAVTGTASQKTRQAVRAARRRCPDAVIVVMGCDAKVDDWDASVDLVVPHPMTSPLSQLLQECLPAVVPPGKEGDGFRIEGAARFSERTRANLKIQDGCNFFCSYCIVPYSRGRARSRALDDVLREADELLEAGYRELVLCGVNLTTYSDGGTDLADLLVRLLALGKDFRIRLGSSEPGDVISRVVEVMRSEPRICRFLHLPLQYGEDTILKRMRRHYTADEYARLALDAVEKVPGLCLGADIITGFPGENEQLFQRCLEFVEALPFGLLHVFPYSPRPGTAAATYPGRPPKALAEQRAARLSSLGLAKAEAFARTQLGRTLNVLVEEDGSGWTDNYLHVTLPGVQIPRNTIVPVRIEKCLGGRELEGFLSRQETFFNSNKKN